MNVEYHRLRPRSLVARRQAMPVAYLGLGILLTPAGSSIQAMYPLWFVGVVILYGLCLGYTFWKQRNREIGFFRYL